MGLEQDNLTSGQTLHTSQKASPIALEEWRVCSTHRSLAESRNRNGLPSRPSCVRTPDYTQGHEQSLSLHDNTDKRKQQINLNTAEVDSQGRPDGNMSMAAQNVPFTPSPPAHSQIKMENATETCG